MRSVSLYSKKTIIAIAVFVLFWAATLAYVLPIKLVRQKTPNLAWQYDQLFGQKWNFFTQPSLANNQLYFVLKNNITNQISDSTDVLKILWTNKKNNAPLNIEEDVLDHIVIRQIAALNEAIYYHLNTESAIHNLAAFGKIMLEKKGYKIDSNSQFKILLYEKNIISFNGNNQTLIPELIFESNYQFFK